MLRETVRNMNRKLALEDIRTLNQVARDATAGERAMAGLVDFFMATALGLVAVGLYGTLSYYIAQRTRQIGVRLAIGAIAGDIQKLVFNQGLRWVESVWCSASVARLPWARFWKVWSTAWMVSPPYP